MVAFCVIRSPAVWTGEGVVLLSTGLGRAVRLFPQVHLNHRHFRDWLVVTSQDFEDVGVGLLDARLDNDASLAVVAEIALVAVLLVFEGVWTLLRPVTDA